MYLFRVLAVFLKNMWEIIQIQPTVVYFRSISGKMTFNFKMCRKKVSEYVGLNPFLVHHGKFHLNFDHSSYYWFIFYNMNMLNSYYTVCYKSNNLYLECVWLRQSRAPLRHCVISGTGAKIPFSVSRAASLPLPPSWVACTLPGEISFYLKNYYIVQQGWILWRDITCKGLMNVSGPN